jgi:hypothetical protein
MEAQGFSLESRSIPYRKIFRNEFKNGDKLVKIELKEYLTPNLMNDYSAYWEICIIEGPFISDDLNLKEFVKFPIIVNGDEYALTFKFDRILKKITDTLRHMETLRNFKKEIKSFLPPSINFTHLNCRDNSFYPECYNENNRFSIAYDPDTFIFDLCLNKKNITKDCFSLGGYSTERLLNTKGRTRDKSRTLNKRVRVYRRRIKSHLKELDFLNSCFDEVCKEKKDVYLVPLHKFCEFEEYFKRTGISYEDFSTPTFQFKLVSFKDYETEIKTLKLILEDTSLINNFLIK